MTGPVRGGTHPDRRSRHVVAGALALGLGLALAGTPTGAAGGARPVDPPSVGAPGAAAGDTTTTGPDRQETTSRPDEHDAPDDGAPWIELEWPAGKVARLGGFLPVVVVVHAGDRLVDGTVRIESDSGLDLESADDLFGWEGAVDPVWLSQTPVGPARVEAPVEVAAGATGEVRVVLPVARTADLFGGMMAGDRPSITAELVVDGTAADRASRQLESAGELVEPVALLPGAAAIDGRPESLSLLDDDENLGAAELRAITGTLAGSGPAALDPFTQLVATPDDLAELSEMGRQSVVTWVGRGGHLILAGDGPAVGFPPGADLADADWHTFGAGDLRAVGDALQAGRWTEVIGPTVAADPATRSGEALTGTASGDVGVAPVTPVLQQDTDFHLPDLQLLVMALAAYAVLAGPVLFVALRGPRRTLIWLVLPGLAVAATGGFVVVGAGARPTVEASHATYVELTGQGGWAGTSVLLGSVPGGTVELTAPGGFTALATEGGSDVQVDDVPIVQLGDTTAAEPDLLPGGMALVRAGGPFTDTTAMAGLGEGIDARVSVRSSVADRETLEVVVTNRTDVDLHHVLALTGHRAVEVGDLAAGGSRTVEIDEPLDIARPHTTGGRPEAELAHWPPMLASLATDGGCLGMGCPPDAPAMRCDWNGCAEIPDDLLDSDEAAMVASSAWADFLVWDGGALRRPGAVTVAGWTDELASPVAIDGAGAIAHGRTVVVRRVATPMADTGRLALRRERTRTVESLAGLRNDIPLGFDVDAGGADVVDHRTPWYSRLLLDATSTAAEGSHPVLRLPGTVDEVSFRVAGSWVTYGRTPFTDDPLDVPVPAGAAVAGVVYVRTTGDIWDDAKNDPTIDLQTWALRRVDAAELAAIVDARADDLERRAALGNLPPPLDQSTSPGPVVFGGAAIQGSVDRAIMEASAP